MKEKQNLRGRMEELKKQLAEIELEKQVGELEQKLRQHERSIERAREYEENMRHAQMRNQYLNEALARGGR